MERTNYLIIVFILSIFLATSFARNSVWRDDVTLWSDTYSKSPHHGRACSGLGYAYVKRGDYLKARKIILECIDTHPLAYPLYLNLATTYRELGDFENEIMVYRRALFAGAVHQSIYNALGDALFKQLELTEAMQEYKAAIAIDPKNAPAHYGIGLIYRAREDYRSAISYFEKASSYDPTNALYQAQLEEAYVLLKRTRK